jgi:hypothetical protein
MDQTTVGIYLSRILSGYYIFFYRGQKYKLIYPNMDIKYEADIYAQEEYENNKFNDWISDDMIVDSLVSIGMWSYNGDDNIKNIEKQIEDLKVDLYQNFLNPPKLKSVRRTLNNTKNTYDKLYQIRHSLDSCTVKGYCNVLKNQYLLMHSIYDNSNNLVFNSKDADFQLLNSLASIIAENTIDLKTFRSIARDDVWKNYWSANNNYVFDQPTINWTDEQKTLVVLTKMYDNAYQHPECPEEKVINDDDMFDGWMILQRREHEKNKNKNRTEKLLEGKKLGKAGEIFIMANSQEEAQNIYDLNDITSRHIIKERHSTIIGTNNDVSDSQLPDVKRNMVVQSNQQFKDTRK